MANTDKQKENSLTTKQSNERDMTQKQNINLLRTNESAETELFYVSEGRVDLIRTDASE